LTAQALPNALGDFRYRYPNAWEAKTLAGLSANELQNEHLEFFSKHGVAVDEENQVILSKLGQVYEGHTLVLQVMSGEIQSKDFGGDVAQYWAVNQQEFEQVARSLDAKRLDETQYNDELDWWVRDRVKQSLQQLPTDAQDLLLRSSVYRRPVPKKFWLGLIDDRSVSQQKEAYRVLCDRALVEKESTDIRQHNLIRAVANALLTDNLLTWKETARQAAHLWLTVYEAAPDAPKLETVRAYLEAFNHYSEIGDWEAASDTYMQNLDATDQLFYWQLFVWGNYQELIQISIRLESRASSYVRIRCFLSLGNANNCLGNPNQAIKWYEKALFVARQTSNRRDEGTALGNLGNSYDYLGEYECARDYYQQHLAIAREIGDRAGEGRAMGNLGNVHKNLGNYERAINILQQRLPMAQEIGDLWGESNTLGTLGIIYEKLGDYATAVDYSQQHLAIACKLGDRRGEGAGLRELGVALLKQNATTEALKNLQSALSIFQEVKSREDEDEALKNLAELHQALGESEIARQYCQQALALATELDIPLAKECRQLMAQLEPTGVQPS
jgi:tetratricopeptide (TPR) repeat protein